MSRVKTSGELPNTPLEHANVLMLKDFLKKTTQFDARLEGLYSNATFFKMLLEFALGRYSGEVVLFWKEIRLIQRKEPDAMALKELYDTFVFENQSSTSDMIVTLPGQVVDECRRAVESEKTDLPRCLVDEAYQAAHNLIDSFMAVYI